MSPFFCCSPRFLVLFFLVSAVPVAYLISLELAAPATHVFHYHSVGWFRECAKWDDLNRRFLVSFMSGGVGQIPVPEHHSPGAVLDELPLVKHVDLAGNASLGLAIDRPRNRLLVATADVMGNKYSALAAYDMSTWNRLFLTQLSGPSDPKAFADDVAVDSEGNAYVTDCTGSLIWKVGVDGKFLSTIKSPLFIPKEWYKAIVGLNGIVYHPDGYLIVIHTFGGNLFKIDISNGDEVKQIKVVEGSLTFGDGLELLSPTQIVVAGNPSGRLVESTDGWETASVVGKWGLSIGWPQQQPLRTERCISTTWLPWDTLRRSMPLLRQSFLLKMKTENSKSSVDYLLLCAEFYFVSCISNKPYFYLFD